MMEGQGCISGLEAILSLKYSDAAKFFSEFLKEHPKDVLTYW
jgi:hypothetical protein